MINVIVSPEAENISINTPIFWQLIELRTLIPTKSKAIATSVDNYLTKPLLSTPASDYLINSLGEENLVEWQRYFHYQAK